MEKRREVCEGEGVYETTGGSMRTHSAIVSNCNWLELVATTRSSIDVKVGPQETDKVRTRVKISQGGIGVMREKKGGSKRLTHTRWNGRGNGNTQIGVSVW